MFELNSFEVLGCLCLGVLRHWVFTVSSLIMACEFYWFGVQRHAVWKPSLEKKAHLAPQLWVLVFSAEQTGSSSADRTMKQLNRAMEATSELLENCLERDMGGLAPVGGPAPPNPLPRTS